MIPSGAKIPVLSSCDPPGTVQAQLTARPGDQFGRYKILEEIGQGGCGAVFVAEQQSSVAYLVGHPGAGLWQVKIVVAS